MSLRKSRSSWPAKRPRVPPHTYEGRFGSRLVKDDRYFLSSSCSSTSRSNPVRAGLCRITRRLALVELPAATAGLCPAPSFLDTQAFLGLLATDDYVAVAEGEEALDEHGVPRPPPRPALEEILVEDSSLAIALAHFRHGYRPGGDCEVPRRECLPDLPPGCACKGRDRSATTRGQARTLRARPRCCVVGSLVFGQT